MQTSTLITLLKKQFPDWSTQNLVDIVNEVHKICLTFKPVSQMRVLADNEYDGDLQLTTTDGVVSYDIDTTNGFSDDVWRITDVYENDINVREDVVCYDATEGVSAKVVFKDNPGIKNVNLRCYKKPTEILSQSVELQIPDNLVLKYFYIGVVAFIEMHTNGSFDNWLLFNDRLLPKMLYAMNDGERGNTYNTKYKGY